ncbi:hypothetical protein DFP72DRAFT_1178783 [Ephemerocybe angulata]|uniref:Uncharacterized protein n=1 Tax=Ephemerocybe angulata TaxID=980116 RepID=A0A8H6H9D3_9AGAR|nr:hypothetical protein DFP72DRAFT_1178783 [Tulosesus angulatus]
MHTLSQHTMIPTTPTIPAACTSSPSTSTSSSSHTRFPSFLHPHFLFSARRFPPFVFVVVVVDDVERCRARCLLVVAFDGRARRLEFSSTSLAMVELTVKSISAPRKCKIPDDGDSQCWTGGNVSDQTTTRSDRLMAYGGLGGGIRAPGNQTRPRRCPHRFREPSSQIRETADTTRRDVSERSWGKVLAAALLRQDMVDVGAVTGVRCEAGGRRLRYHWAEQSSARRQRGSYPRHQTSAAAAVAHQASVHRVA